MASVAGPLRDPREMPERPRKGAGGRTAQPQRRQRRALTWWLLAPFVLILVVVMVMIALYQLAMARRDLQRGARELDAAFAVVQRPAALQQPVERGVVRADLARARVSLGSAREPLAPWSPLLVHLAWLPGAGPELAAAPRLSNAAWYATSAALDLLDGLQPVWSGPSPTMSLARLAPRLQAGQPRFAAARTAAQSAWAQLSSFHSPTGNATLDHDIVRLRHGIAVLRPLSDWLALAPNLLGVQHPSTYLLAWQDPAELRATGGFIGAADYVTLRRGAIATTFSSSALPHEVQVVEPLPEAMYTAEPSWLFRDANWSPDFPLSANLERWLYGRDTGRWVDGVINLGGGAAPDLLRASGPLYLPSYGRWVNANNVMALAQQYVNGPYKGPIHTGVTADTVRKQFLDAVTQALFTRLQALPLARLPALAAAFHQAVSQEDILLYDNRPQVEAAIQAIGAAGAIPHPAGDFLYVVDDNRSYSKLNPYVQERASYAVTIAPNLSLQATLRLRYHVNPSPANLEGAGAMFGAEGSKHDYLDFLRVYVPRGAQLEATSGLQRWVPARAYGLTQFAGAVLVRENRTVTVTIRYRIPANVFAWSGFRRYRLTVQRQPASNIASVSLLVHGEGGLTVQAGKRSMGTDSIVLPLHGHGSVLTLSLHGATRPQLVTLPPLPAHPDPYIPYSTSHFLLRSSP